MERKQFTLAEVAKNKGENGARCWIIISSLVYDVTDYMEQHPGGSELIAEYAGRNATDAFEDFGHSTDAKKQLKKYEIGVLVKQENGKIKQPKIGLADPEKISIKAGNRQRRKFLSLILGSCAST